jgi:hypothetical protein
MISQDVLRTGEARGHRLLTVTLRNEGSKSEGMKMNIQIRAIGLSQRHNAAKSVKKPANCVNLKNKSEILAVDIVPSRRPSRKGVQRSP